MVAWPPAGAAADDQPVFEDINSMSVHALYTFLQQARTELDNNQAPGLARRCTELNALIAAATARYGQLMFEAAAPPPEPAQIVPREAEFANDEAVEDPLDIPGVDLDRSPELVKADLINTRAQYMTSIGAFVTILNTPIATTGLSMAGNRAALEKLQAGVNKISEALRRRNMETAAEQTAAMQELEALVNGAPPLPVMARGVIEDAMDMGAADDNDDAASVVSYASTPAEGATDVVPQPPNLEVLRQAAQDRAQAIHLEAQEIACRDRERLQELLREADRGRREAEDRANEARREVAAARQRQRCPLIAELSAVEYDSFKQQLADDIEANHVAIIREVNTLLPHGWREVLEQVTDAHRAQVHTANTPMNARRVKIVNVCMTNGDFQRGKSTIEALYAVIQCAIHRSTTVADVGCTLVVSQLRAWAVALLDTMQSKAVRPAHMAAAAAAAPQIVELDEDLQGLDNEEGGIAASDLGDLPLARISGKNGRASVKACLQAGGSAVFFRTGAQYETFGKMLAEINDLRISTEKAYVSIVVLDEGDKFLGDPRADHARQLLHLLGLGGPRQANRPALVVVVSATNIGPCYYFWRRMHLQRPQQGAGSLLINVDDIVGFKPVNALAYRHESQPVLADGEAMDVPRPDSAYTTTQIVDAWFGAFAKPSSLIIDTATVRVNVGVEHNMLEHVDEICWQMEQKRLAIPDDVRPDPVPGVVVYLHGGHTTHLGMIGIQFINEEQISPRVEAGELPPTALLMGRLEASIRAAAASESARLLTLQGVEYVDDAAVAYASGIANALTQCADSLDDNFNTHTECLEVHYLTEFAWWIRDEAIRRGFYSGQQLKSMLDPTPVTFDRDACSGRSFWSSGNLQLVLFIIRKFIGDEVPIALIGASQVRRSLGPVAVDFFRGPIDPAVDGPEYDVTNPDTGLPVYAGQPKCLVAVTHTVQSRFANSADGSQTHMRFATTLTNWNVAHPELAVVKDLVINDVTEATRGFISFNAMAPMQQPIATRRATNTAIAVATRPPQRAITIASFEQSLQTQDQRDWFSALYEQLDACEDAGDEISDKHALLALACTLATHIPLPEEVVRLLQRHRNPMFQRSCGNPERDLGNLHANLITILNGREPLTFRHALETRRGRRGGGPGPLGGAPLLAAQWLADNNWRALDDGSMPNNAPESWSVFWGLRSTHPHLIAADGIAGVEGFKELGITGNHGCGLGFAMRNLENRGIVYSATAMRPRPAPTPGPHGMVNGPSHERPRQVKVYWLAPGQMPVGNPASPNPAVGPP